MRPFRAALTVLTALLMSLVVAGPASAGGPTSVLLVEPDTRNAASLYYVDADYQALAGLVGADKGSGVAGTVDRSGSTHEFGSGITLTWLIHDVAVWRVDRVFVEAKGGPWIATQSDIDDAGISVFDSPVVWHTAADGPALTALLEQVGFGPAAKPVGGNGSAVSAGNAPAPAAEPQPNASPDTGSTGVGAWLWGLSGLALGAALTLAAVRLLPASRHVTAEAENPAPAFADAFDLVPPVEPEDARDWSIPDELSSTSRRN